MTMTMMIKHVVVCLMALIIVSEAFAPIVINTHRRHGADAMLQQQQHAAATTTSTCLFMGCRVNAKKEKLKRNRENMRKFKSSGSQTGPGRRTLTRRRMLKKVQASRARQEEAEFIAKCFITLPAAGEEEDDDDADVVVGAGSGGAKATAQK